jgi:hypothetical protein
MRVRGRSGTSSAAIAQLIPWFAVAAVVVLAGLLIVLQIAT